MYNLMTLQKSHRRLPKLITAAVCATLLFPFDHALADASAELSRRTLIGAWRDYPINGGHLWTSVQRREGDIVFRADGTGVDYGLKDFSPPFKWHRVSFRWRLEKDWSLPKGQKPNDLVVFHEPGQDWTNMYYFSADRKLLILKNYGFKPEELFKIGRGR